MLNISISSVMAGLIFGAGGLWLFREGKRKGDLRLIVISVLLMGYSYLTPNAWWDWGVGVALSYAAYSIWN